jgi:hypothetical protein
VSKLLVGIDRWIILATLIAWAFGTCAIHGLTNCPWVTAAFAAWAAGVLWAVVGAAFAERGAGGAR